MKNQEKKTSMSVKIMAGVLAGLMILSVVFGILLPLIQ